MDRTRQTRDAHADAARRGGIRSGESRRAKAEANDYYGSPTERKATRRFEHMFGIPLFDSPTYIEDQETEALPAKERDHRDA